MLKLIEKQAMSCFFSCKMTGNIVYLSWEESSMTYVWLVAIIILGFIEAITEGIVSIWFVISGLLALIVSLFTDVFLIQFAIFVIVGIILMITTRASVSKYLKVNPVRTNLDRVIGMKGIVSEDIKKDKYGEVRVDGKRWTAYSKDEKVIKKDEFVEILNIDGNKLVVKKIKE